MIVDVTSAPNKKTAVAQTSQAQAESLRSILNIMPVGVILLDKFGVVYEANPAAHSLLGEPLINQSWLNIIQQKFHARSDDGHEISLVTGERVNVATHPLEGQGGQLITLTDLTETRSLQESLNRYQRLCEIGRMSAAMAHQIRTPLASALLYVGGLNNKNISDEKKYDFCEKISKQLKILDNQVSNMLLFAQGGNQCVEQVSITALIDEIMLVYQGRKIICIDFKQAVRKTIFLGNIKTLASAIVNLIENSEQAIDDDDDHIYLLVEYANNYLNIKIIDEGLGMTAQEQQKALEPFFTTKPQGTGLGLAVAQAVLHAHQGKLTLTSDKNLGTTVHLSLPTLTKQGVSQ
ncbi:Sporulation kinase E [Piscirickettsia salmonis]|uniref:sensor histidine kinase n=1 Tax=Piscirickettsia salmonis TaxID=1238 RepID=UPI0012BA5998|nr:ATP-binding protein [Piscirickettsia salmonis]QGP56191.1 Sporulation kinase E [Piscirickettsia salmonis]QGP57932.1 Sporulation kinase E [Piscirickettsia salmonis]QGP65760.1 Sporulation kinase E [Piscirickettsia salmonis]